MLEVLIFVVLLGLALIASWYIFEKAVSLKKKQSKEMQKIFSEIVGENNTIKQYGSGNKASVVGANNKITQYGATYLPPVSKKKKDDEIKAGSSDSSNPWLPSNDTYSSSGASIFPFVDNTPSSDDNHTSFGGGHFGGGGSGGSYDSGSSHSSSSHSYDSGSSYSSDSSSYDSGSSSSSDSGSSGGDW